MIFLGDLCALIGGYVYFGRLCVFWVPLCSSQWVCVLGLEKLGPNTLCFGLNVWQDNFDGFFDRPWEVLDEYMCVLFRGFSQWGGFDYVVEEPVCEVFPLSILIVWAFSVLTG
jgi:hypothetical protein